MNQEMINRLLASIEQAANLYYRLVIIVAPSGEGKTEVLKEVSNRLKLPIINMNLELSRLLLDLTQKQRTLQLPKILEDIVAKYPGDTVLSPCHYPDRTKLPSLPRRTKTCRPVPWR